jgi:hypothetical protein
LLPALKAVSRPWQPGDAAGGFGGCAREKLHQVDTVTFFFTKLLFYRFDEQAVRGWRDFIVLIKNSQEVNDFPVITGKFNASLACNNLGNLWGPVLRVFQKSFIV